MLAALIAHGRQMLQLSLDLQGWLWLVLGVGLSLLSLLANGAGLGVVLRWLGLRPRWAGLLAFYLATNLRKYLPGGIWHLTSRGRLICRCSYLLLWTHCTHLCHLHLTLHQRNFVGLNVLLELRLDFFRKQVE